MKQEDRTSHIDQYKIRRLFAINRIPSVSNTECLVMLHQSNYMPLYCFLLGNSPVSEFYMPTFQNSLFHLHRQVGACRMSSAGGMFGVLYGKRFVSENGLSH